MTAQTVHNRPTTAAEMMDKLNSETADLHCWIRTQANSPAQRAWFADPGGATGAGNLAKGRVAANQMKMLPHRWRWKEISPFLYKIGEIARNADVKPLETTDRQGILLTNPGLGGRLQITNSIRAAIAIYNPGDVAPAHIHSPNASRTILSDKGGYTNVEGEKCVCRRGDIVFTPNGTWHDHGNEDSEPMIWIDMLDWPLMEYLDCVWVDQDYRDPGGGNSKSQPVTHQDGHSTRLYGSGGLKPVLDSNQRGWGQGMSPMFHFRGADIRATLEGLKDQDGDPFEGIKMQIVNPVSGKPIYPTLDYSAQLLRPGEETQFKRETSSAYALVIAGKGFSEIGSERYDWEENDVMAIPNFLWRRHVNNGSEDAIIYTTSDKSLLENIGQYRSQGKAKDGSIVQLVQ